MEGPSGTGSASASNSARARFLQEPVARDAALGERDDLHVLSGRLPNELPDLPQVRGLVARGVFELDRGDPYVAHTG